jgi:hypothetical protein
MAQRGAPVHHPRGRAVVPSPYPSGSAALLTSAKNPSAVSP